MLVFAKWKTDTLNYNKMEYCKNEVKKYKLSFLLLESTNMVTLSNYKFLNVFKALNMSITDWAVPLLGVCANKIRCLSQYYFNGEMWDPPNS